MTDERIWAVWRWLLPPPLPLGPSLSVTSRVRMLTFLSLMISVCHLMYRSQFKLESWGKWSQISGAELKCTCRFSKDAWLVFGRQGQDQDYALDLFHVSPCRHQGVFGAKFAFFFRICRTFSCSRITGKFKLQSVGLMSSSCSLNFILSLVVLGLCCVCGRAKSMVFVVLHVKAVSFAGYCMCCKNSCSCTEDESP